MRHLLHIPSFRLLLLLPLLFTMCGHGEDPVQEVDPFIGTGGEGHLWPGAALPFGMVQVSPDTRTHGHAACGGYYHPDTLILGFSHTHLPGVGEPEYRDLLLMPVTGTPWLATFGEGRPLTGYSSRYRHTDEEAVPGYYRVFLDDPGITAEVTATARCALHRYTFPASDSSGVIIDLTYPGGAEALMLRRHGDCELAGYRRSHGWAWDEHLYFVIRFSKPFTAFLPVVNDTLCRNRDSIAGKNIRALVTFPTKKNEQVLIKAGLSAVSIDGARKNLEAELNTWDFPKVRQAARCAWQRELQRITVEGGTPRERTLFYTAMYHAFLAPYLYMDVDSLYRGVDHRIHRARGFTNYTVFSLWDTYRALHPLFTLVQPRRTNIFIRSLLAKYDDGGRLPMWPLAGNYTDDMIGYHAVAVIADAWMKGLRGYDPEKAWRAMSEVARLDRLGLRYYRERGYVPDDRQGESVSKTLEYAYDDWCIARMAAALGHGDSLIFYQRALSYRNVFDTVTLFMRPRRWDRSWFSPFDPLSGHGFTEGNGYQYLYVPHDMEHLIALMGGDSLFCAWLDTLFTREGGHRGKAWIGQYNQGNEPSHHLAYLYSFAGRPWKTQERVHRIMEQCYTDRPDGISGNDDAGQMSAWYIFSALGFYPVLPGAPWYVLGTPLFPLVTLHLSGGRTFTIETRGGGEGRCFIRAAELNGHPFRRTYLTHQEIIRGGRLVLHMDSLAHPAALTERPPSTGIPPLTRRPWLKEGKRLFLDSTLMILACDHADAVIRYTLDGTLPGPDAARYTGPFVVDSSVILTMTARAPGMLPSAPVTIRLEKARPLPASSTASLAPGLHYSYYERFFVTTGDLLLIPPLTSGITPRVDLSVSPRTTYFGLRFTGYLRVPATGIYTFFLASNDGSTLYLDDRRVVENDGNHPLVEEWGSIALEKGMHKMEVRYFQCGGSRDLRLSWQGPDLRKQEIPAPHLFHEKKWKESTQPEK